MSVIALTAARVPSARLSLYDNCGAWLGEWGNWAVGGAGTVSTRLELNCSVIGRVTLSNNAFENWTGLSGLSCSDDSQVPGIAISCTSGQLGAWGAGRGLCGYAALLVGGTMLGGTALGGVSRCRRTPTTTKITSPTTSGTAGGAINRRKR